MAKGASGAPGGTPIAGNPVDPATAARTQANIDAVGQRNANMTWAGQRVGLPGANGPPRPGNTALEAAAAARTQAAIDANNRRIANMTWAGQRVGGPLPTPQMSNAGLSQALAAPSPQPPLAQKAAANPLNFNLPDAGSSGGY